MASVKSGSWFLELILNILLLAGVALVTFASRSEQERGLAVPLFAAVSPATTRPAFEAPNPDGVPAAPAVTAPGATPGATTGVVAPGPQAPAAGAGASPSFEQAWGALQIWAAGLDGTISADELKRIQDSLSPAWQGTQGVRDYLKTVNERINSGQAEQVVQEALGVIAQQANEKKALVMKSVVEFMRSNGISWEQTQQVMTRWVTQALKLSPADVISFVKSLMP